MKNDLGRHMAVNEAMVRAHRLAVEALRAGPGNFPVGLTLSMSELQAAEGGEEAKAAAEELLEDMFLRATGGDDFIGVQVYTRMRFGPKGRLLGAEEGVPVTQMGYEYWPQAVEFTVRRAAQATGSRWW